MWRGLWQAEHRFVWRVSSDGDGCWRAGNGRMCSIGIAKDEERDVAEWGTKVEKTRKEEVIVVSLRKQEEDEEAPVPLPKVTRPVHRETTSINNENTTNTHPNSFFILKTTFSSSSFFFLNYFLEGLCWQSSTRFAPLQNVYYVVIRWTLSGSFPHSCLSLSISRSQSLIIFT